MSLVDKTEYLEQRLHAALWRGDVALSDAQDLMEQIEKLQAVADISKGILMHGDLLWHTPHHDRQMREDALRAALACLPNAQDQTAGASDARQTP
jgi:hypothetical protein